MAPRTRRGGRVGALPVDLRRIADWLVSTDGTDTDEQRNLHCVRTWLVTR